MAGNCWASRVTLYLKSVGCTAGLPRLLLAQKLVDIPSHFSAESEGCQKESVFSAACNQQTMMKHGKKHSIIRVLFSTPKCQSCRRDGTSRLSAYAFQVFSSLVHTIDLRLSRLKAAWNLTTNTRDVPSFETRFRQSKSNSSDAIICEIRRAFSVATGKSCCHQFFRERNVRLCNAQFASQTFDLDSLPYSSNFRFRPLKPWSSSCIDCLHWLFVAHNCRPFRPSRQNCS